MRKNLLSNPKPRGGVTNVKKRVTRRDKREALDTFNLCVELWKIINHFFPDLIPMIKRTKDHRHQSYIEYKKHVILFTRILVAVFRIESMRKTTESLNKVVCLKNISQILGLEEELEELPHWSTINNYLEQLQASELEKIIQKLVVRLTRMRSFENSRIRNKYWQVIIDGTHLYTFSEQHCEHCLKREFKDEEGNVVRREYYHVVLEAKLVIEGNMVISIATEFVENESQEVKKQDCELNAFYRLAEKLKQNFPKLPICLGMDSLYAAAPVFSLCRKYNWHYIIRFKDGSISSLAKEFHALKHMEPSQTWSKIEDNVKKTYRYVTGILYQSHELNIVEYEQSNLKYPFVFVTDLPISRRNCEQLVLDGRRRWKIENEGFNAQKNQGMGLEHMFSEDYTAIKNHYFLIQIGHMIAQFLEAGIKRLMTLATIPAYQLFEDIKESFRTVLLTQADAKLVSLQTQYRLR